MQLIQEKGPFFTLNSILLRDHFWTKGVKSGCRNKGVLILENDKSIGCILETSGHACVHTKTHMPQPPQPPGF